MLPRRGDRYEAADVDRAIAEAWPESATLEYKADPASMPDDRRRLSPEQKLEIIVARAVSAFANTGGGVLVLGVGQKDGQPMTTTPPGLPRSLGRDTVDERVAIMISRCVEPHPSCRVEPAPIDDGRAYVLVDVAPRGGGPHRITNTSDPTLNGRYYVRRGRESVEADHYTLRALFAEAAEEGQRVREYLARQGLDNLNDEDLGFGMREPARHLSYESNKRGGTAAIVTLIPEVLRGDLFDMQSPAIRSLLTTGGGAGWHEERATLEGRMLFRGGDRPLLQAYFHVHRNGYIEAGDARIGAMTDNGKQVFAHAIDAVLEATLDAAARLYEAIQLRERLLVSTHLRSVSDSKLAIRGRPQTWGLNTRRNVTIAELVSLDALRSVDTRVLFDRRLGNAFGLDAGFVLDADGSKRTAFSFE